MRVLAGLVVAPMFFAADARAGSSDGSDVSPSVPAVQDRLLIGFEYSTGSGMRAGYERWSGHTMVGAVFHGVQIAKQEGALNDGDVVRGTSLAALAVAGVYADRKHRWGLEVGAGPGYVTGSYEDRETDESASHAQGALFLDLSLRLWPIVVGIQQGLPPYEFSGAPEGLALLSTTGRFWIGVRFKIPSST